MLHDIWRAETREDAQRAFDLFLGNYGAKYLNENWFLSLEDAEEKIEAWRIDYNEHRPHSALGEPGSQGFRFNLPG